MDQTTYIYLDHAATTPLRSTAKKQCAPTKRLSLATPPLYTAVAFYQKAIRIAGTDGRGVWLYARRNLFYERRHGI